MPWYAGSDTAGVLTLNGASGAVTLAVVGGSIATAGSTITITITPGVTSWADLPGKPSTFPPSTHGHIVADVTGLQAALDGKQAAGSYVIATDSRLSDSREWSASTVTQAAAEAGTDTARVAWTVVRVWQAVAAWWAASAAKVKLDGVATGATANSSDATLLARANHTGTQSAGTITGLATVATSGAYADLSGKPTLGTAAASATTDFAAASHSHGNITNAGAIGSTSDQIVVTTTSGVMTVATIGTGLTLSGGTLTASGGVTDGDKGDVTVSGAGATWTINAGAIATADLADGAVTLAKTTGLQKSITVSSAAPSGGSSGDLYVQTSAAGQVTPATLTADVNDYAPGAGDIYRLSANAARRLTGWQAWTDGTVKLAVNVGVNNITLPHQSASSSANNRFITPTAGDYIIAPGGSAAFYWDATDSRVRLL